MNVKEPAVAADAPPWSSRSTPPENIFGREVPENCREADRIMVFRVIAQKTCGTERSTLLDRKYEIGHGPPYSEETAAGNVFRYRLRRR